MSVEKLFADPIKKIRTTNKKEFEVLFFVVLVFQPKECPPWAKTGIEDV